MSTPTRSTRPLQLFPTRSGSLNSYTGNDGGASPTITSPTNASQATGLTRALSNGNGHLRSPSHGSSSIGSSSAPPVKLPAPPLLAKLIRECEEVIPSCDVTPTEAPGDSVACVPKKYLAFQCRRIRKRLEVLVGALRMSDDSPHAAVAWSNPACDASCQTLMSVLRRVDDYLLELDSTDTITEIIHSPLQVGKFMEFSTSLQACIAGLEQALNSTRNGQSSDVPLLPFDISVFDSRKDREDQERDLARWLSISPQERAAFLAAVRAKEEDEINSRRARKKLAPLSVDEMNAQVNTQAYAQALDTMLQGQRARLEQERDRELLDHPYLHVPYSDIELGTKIGEGGFGVVYRAVWRNLGAQTTVAIKELYLKDAEMSEEARGIFLRELMIMKEVQSCEHVVAIRGAVRDKERMAIIMEYCSLGAVYDLIHSGVELSWLDRLLIMHEACQAVVFMHSLDPKRPLLHGDLKTSNLLLTNRAFDEREDRRLQPTFCTKVSDFGLARAKEETTSTVKLQAMMADLAQCSSSVQRARASQQALAGSDGYTAPEVLAGSMGAMTVASDCFALGVILFELVTRQQPWAHQGDLGQYPTDDVHSLRSYIRSGGILSLSEENWLQLAAVPHLLPLEDMIKQATSKQPQNRPTVAELRDKLYQLIEAHKEALKTEFARQAAPVDDSSSSMQKSIEQVPDERLSEVQLLGRYADGDDYTSSMKKCLEIAEQLQSRFAKAGQHLAGSESKAMTKTGSVELSSLDPIGIVPHTALLPTVLCHCFSRFRNDESAIHRLSLLLASFLRAMLYSSLEGKIVQAVAQAVSTATARIVEECVYALRVHNRSGSFQDNISDCLRRLLSVERRARRHRCWSGGPVAEQLLNQGAVPFLLQALDIFGKQGKGLAALQLLVLLLDLHTPSDPSCDAFAISSAISRAGGINILLRGLQYSISNESYPYRDVCLLLFRLSENPDCLPILLREQFFRHAAEKVDTFMSRRAQIKLTDGARPKYLPVPELLVGCMRRLLMEPATRQASLQQLKERFPKPVAMHLLRVCYERPVTLSEKEHSANRPVDEPVEDRLSFFFEEFYKLLRDLASCAEGAAWLQQVCEPKGETKMVGLSRTIRKCQQFVETGIKLSPEASKAIKEVEAWATQPQSQQPLSLVEQVEVIANQTQEQPAINSDSARNVSSTSCSSKVTAVEQLSLLHGWASVNSLNQIRENILAPILRSGRINASEVLVSLDFDGTLSGRRITPLRSPESSGRAVKESFQSSLAGAEFCRTLNTMGVPFFINTAAKPSQVVPSLGPISIRLNAAGQLLPPDAIEYNEVLSRRAFPSSVVFPPSAAATVEDIKVDCTQYPNVSEHGICSVQQIKGIFSAHYDKDVAALAAIQRYKEATGRTVRLLIHVDDGAQNVARVHSSMTDIVPCLSLFFEQEAGTVPATSEEPQQQQAVQMLRMGNIPTIDATDWCNNLRQGSNSRGSIISSAAPPLAVRQLSRSSLIMNQPTTAADSKPRLLRGASFRLEVAANAPVVPIAPFLQRLVQVFDDPADVSVESKQIPETQISSKDSTAASSDGKSTKTSSPSAVPAAPSTSLPLDATPMAPPTAPPIAPPVAPPFAPIITPDAPPMAPSAPSLTPSIPAAPAAPAPPGAPGPPSAPGAPGAPLAPAVGKVAARPVKKWAAVETEQATKFQLPVVDLSSCRCRSVFETVWRGRVRSYKALAEGQTHAVFFLECQDGIVVLKALDSDNEAVRVDFCNLIAKHCGRIATAAARKVNQKEKEELGSAYAALYSERTDWEKSELCTALRSEPHFVLLEFVPAQALKGIGAEKPSQTGDVRRLTHADIWEMGRIFAFDVVVHNTDRFPCRELWARSTQLMQMEGNAGNLLLGPNPGQVCAIDHQIEALAFKANDKKTPLQLEQDGVKSSAPTSVALDEIDAASNPVSVSGPRSVFSLSVIREVDTEPGAVVERVTPLVQVTCPQSWQLAQLFEAIVKLGQQRWDMVMPKLKQSSDFMLAYLPRGKIVNKNPNTTSDDSKSHRTSSSAEMKNSLSAGDVSSSAAAVVPLSPPSETASQTFPTRWSFADWKRISHSSLSQLPWRDLSPLENMTTHPTHGQVIAIYIPSETEIYAQSVSRLLQELHTSPSADRSARSEVNQRGYVPPVTTVPLNQSSSAKTDLVTIHEIAQDIQGLTPADTL